jgi:hypothetical protein
VRLAAAVCYWFAVLAGLVGSFSPRLAEDPAVRQFPAPKKGLVFFNRPSKLALVTRHLSRTGLAKLLEAVIHTKPTRVIA